MKRRGFLGLLGGAAVAGPSMVKEAAAATIADLNVAALAGGVAVPDFGQEPVGIASAGHTDWAVRSLAKLGLRTAEQHAYYRRRLRVQSLDPDLASCRSFALHHKIRVQREREYVRSLEDERGYLEATIAGWFSE